MSDFNPKRARSEKTYRIFRSIYDFTMAALILGCAVVMFAAKYFHLDQVINLDNEWRIIFGCMCLLYGGFRLYRGFQRDY
ncbi:MAG: hypothetical protein RLZ95_897 [Bacteroidota bacterium]|jgi:uncharacterized membrane protein YkvI